MSTELTLDFVQSQLPARQRSWVDDEIVKEIQKLADNPDYGEEFIDSYIDHLNVLGNNSRYTHKRYLQAVKFFSLVEAGNSLTDAYIKVFPERYRDRRRNSSDPDQDKSIMRQEASRFNKSQMLAEIRMAATIPVQLIHRHLLHEAILESAELMRTAKSELVRQKAAATLITELKPQEDQVLKIDVQDGARSVIEELRIATEKLASAEHQSVQAGIPLKQIADARIIEGEYEELRNTLPEQEAEEEDSSPPPLYNDLEEEVEDVEMTELGEEKKRWKL